MVDVIAASNDRSKPVRSYFFIGENHYPAWERLISMNYSDYMNNYIYRGDRLTTEFYKGRGCNALSRPDGKCIRGKNGNILVEFEGNKVVVLARQLRKIKNCK